VVPAKVQDKDGNIVLRPIDASFLDFRFTALTAYTCINCGFTEFYAEEPEQL
jgi:predicted nucleic-acid-binding Zn-ribbon protein